MSNPNKFILALDQGTTTSRAIIFNHDGKIVASSQKPFEQIFPKPGWVEHNSNEIWTTQVDVAAAAIAKAGLSGSDIAGIGITNQRESTVVWDKKTGIPIYNAIVWQDRRTSDYCQELKAKGLSDIIQKKTGLVIDAYFSATKIKWILDNVKGAKERAEKGELCFGTIDSWLVWKFTEGSMHITDATNASRTMLFNIHTLEYDKELLQLFDIPENMLPEVRSSSQVYGETSSGLFYEKIPISGIAGDQQAALFGQLCLREGMTKTTYGTGCFVVMNTGDEAVISRNNLLATIAWKINGKVSYALEGGVFVGGAAVQWLRDGIGMIEASEESETLAAKVSDNGGVYFVPAMTGLGAPYWDQYARGAIFGITRGSTSAHIARATLESIAYQVHDVVKAMESDCGQKAAEMRVDGGAVANNILMQFQADILRTRVKRPEILETTALGAAYLAGLAVGYWKDTDQLKKQWNIEKEFNPKMKEGRVLYNLKQWQRAVKRSQNWASEEDNY